jgi:hypothetical protein
MAVSNRSLLQKSVRAYFDRFYTTVDAFGRVIADLEDNRVDDAPQMVFYGLGHHFDGFQAAAHGPGQPSLPALAAQVGCTSCHRFRAISLIAHARAVRNELFFND